VFYLFGTVMAGYLLAILVPFGFGTVARSCAAATAPTVKPVLTGMTRHCAKPG
jgi:predicted Na+-dependent transporter